MEFSGSEIKNRTFEKNFRGYDKDEVDQFLNQLAVSYDDLLKENAFLRERVEKSEKESKQLKEVEASLFRTLKAAEDTGAAIIEEANEAADEIMKEANDSAQKMLNEAQSIANSIVKEAEINAKYSFDSLKKDAFSFIQGYDHLIQQRKQILESLKNLQAGLENHIQATEIEVNSFDNHEHQLMISELETTFGIAIQQIKDNKGQEEIFGEIKEDDEDQETNHPDENLDDLTIDDMNERLEEEEEEKEEEYEEEDVLNIAINEQVIIEDYSDENISEEFFSEEEPEENLENANPGDSITWKNEIPTPKEEDSPSKNKKDSSFFDELD